MGRKNRKEEYDYNETLDEEWLNDENNKEAATPSTEEVVITGKKKKSKDKKTEDTAEENANEEEIVFSGKKKKNAKAKATKADTETTEESAEPEKTEEEIVITGKKKKATKKKEEPKTEKTETTPAVVTKATDTTETAETPEAQETTSSKKKKKKEDEKAKKKPGIGKALAAQLTKMREEEERKQKELEEKRKREEEEERLRIEQEEKEEEERRIQREIKKKLEKERKLAQQKEQEAKKLEAIRQQLVSSYGTTAAADAPQEQKKRVVYGDKRKKKPNAKENTENTTPSTTTTTTEEVQKTEEKTEAVVEVKPSDQKAEQAEETWESWEDKDIDSWESHLKEEEENPVVEEVKPAVPSPAPVAAPTTTTDSNNNNKTESAEDKSGELRSPICCILGHVDTGKTKLLDNIRRTNVQEGEAGGITQQIGATFFPMDAVKEKTKKLAEQFNSLSIKVPGLLIIDTPGHESFNNLRSRGSGLCDIAVLVVDIMHGLEPQTLESINLLKMRKTPFIVALNKVDRIYGWQAMKDEPIQSALLKQSKSVQMEFEERVKETIVAFAEQSLNAQLYYKNKSLKEFRTIVSLVPTSAIDGTGIPDLLMLLIQLTQKLMSDKLLQLSQLQCTVLEVKAIEGLGTTIDCILVNGVLREGDTIVVCGMNGPIVTTIRALLTPQPLKEMRVKGTYIHHKVIHASQGVKIAAQELDKAIAGSSLFVVGPNDDIEALKKEVMQDLENMRKRVDTTGRGVWVQASTLGSLEALLEFLKESKIPVSGVNIGPVNKKDVMKCSIMLEHAAEYAVILAFDVKVTKDAQDLADNMGVKIFTAEIIYHLFDQFTAYMKKLTEDKKTEAASEAVFPCRLRIYPEYIFNKRDPIVLGVEILEGSLRIGTPISVATKECIELGKVTSIELNHKAQEKAKKGLSVAIKIEVGIGEQKREFGRHFDEKDELVSKITRSSLDLLKANFKDELDKDDVHLLKKLKDLFIKYGKFGADF